MRLGVKKGDPVMHIVEVSSARVVAHISGAEEVGATCGQCPLEHFILIGGKRPGWLSFDNWSGSGALRALAETAGEW